jgi:hypothetical protein
MDLSSPVTLEQLAEQLERAEVSLAGRLPS